METEAPMPAPTGTVSLILGAVTLAAVIYLYVMVQKVQKELQSSQSDVKTIAVHLEEEVHPAVEVLRKQQGELRRVLSASRQEMITSCGPHEEDIAQAMLHSIMGVSMRQGGQSAALAAEIESINTDEEEEGPFEDYEEDEEEEELVDETEEYEDA
jgi:hypothetical protein